MYSASSKILCLIFVLASGTAFIRFLPIFSKSLFCFSSQNFYFTSVLKIFILFQFSKFLFYFSFQNINFISVFKIFILLQFSKFLFYFNYQNSYFTSVLKIFILLQFSKFLFYFNSQNFILLQLQFPLYWHSMKGKNISGI